MPQDTRRERKNNTTAKSACPDAATFLRPTCTYTKHSTPMLIPGRKQSGVILSERGTLSRIINLGETLQEWLVKIVTSVQKRLRLSLVYKVYIVSQTVLITVSNQSCCICFAMTHCHIPPAAMNAQTGQYQLVWSLSVPWLGCHTLRSMVFIQSWYRWLSAEQQYLHC